MKKQDKLKSTKFVRSKVTFDSGFGKKKSQKSLVDEKFKSITVRTTDNKIKNIWAKKFTDQELEGYIKEIKNRRNDEEDNSDLYSSIFHTTLSSIKSMKSIPMEFIHLADKDERYLKNYQKQRRIWKKRVVSISKQLKSKNPNESLMRSSDAFAEEQLK